MKGKVSRDSQTKAFRKISSPDSIRVYQKQLQFMLRLASTVQLISNTSVELEKKFNHKKCQ